MSTRDSLARGHGQCRSRPRSDGREVALRFEGLRGLRRGWVGLGESFERSRDSPSERDSVEAYGDIYNHPYIAMEYVEGKDLHQTIRSFAGLPGSKSVGQVRADFGGHLQGSGTCASTRIGPPRFKAINILMTEEGGQLTDFGIVKDLDPNRTRLPQGHWLGHGLMPPNRLGSAARSSVRSLFAGRDSFCELTSRRPFAAKDMMGYRRAHLEVLLLVPATSSRRFLPISTDLLALAPKGSEGAFNRPWKVYRLEQLEEEHLESNLETWRPPCR